MIENNINKSNFENLNYKLKVIDNFLSQVDYDRLCKLEINKSLNKSFMVYHNEINENGIIKSVIDKKLIQDLYKNYHALSMKILRELCPEKLELYEYSDFTIIVTNKDSKFPIHDDTPNKLLSGVIYLAPENNSGTIFYNDKVGHGKTEIEWKTNRAVFFSREEKRTWHSYEGDGKNNRIALVYNLMTTQIKKVFKIEKKNYFIGNLRWKLSPHIFRYLKIII